MKILLNLSTRAGSHARYTLAWSVPVALGAIFLLIYFSVGALRDFRSYRKYQTSLLELQKQEARLGDAERSLRTELDQPQPRETFQMAKFANTLIDKKEFSVSSLMEKVAKLLPPEVRLEGLTFARAGSGATVRLSVVGKSAEAVETFLSNLEQSADFRSVSVLNQGLQEGEGPENPSTLTCIATYAGKELR